MVAQIIGFLFMCAACCFFLFVALLSFFVAPQFEGRAGTFLFGLIMLIMAFGMGYGAYCNSPFHLTIG